MPAPHAHEKPRYAESSEPGQNDDRLTRRKLGRSRGRSHQHDQGQKIDKDSTAQQYILANANNHSVTDLQVKVAQRSNQTSAG